MGRSWIEYDKLRETGVFQSLHKYLEEWNKSLLISSQSVLHQAYTVIPNALPFKISFALGAFRNYLKAIPQSQQYEPPNHPLSISWKNIAHSTRLASMVAFWAFDNIAFLANIGFLDTVPFSLPFFNTSRKNHSTTDIGPIAARMANRTFFFSSLLQLFMSWKDWKDHQQGILKDTWQQYQHKQQKVLSSALSNAQDSTDAVAAEGETETLSAQLLPLRNTLNQELEQMKQTWEKVQNQHFTLFLNLLKVLYMANYIFL